MGWFSKRSNSSLSIERLLEESREKNVVELRKTRLKRSGFAHWGIWKLLRIEWK